MSTIEKALAKQKQASLDKKTQDDEPSETMVHTKSDNPVNNNNHLSSQHESNKSKIILDGENLLSRGYMFDAGTRKVTQEEFRQIKRKLLNNAFGPASKTLDNSNLVMVSSSNPNEGKTFVSINLALSIALEQDKTVLLVDADVLRPSLNRELGFETDKGLLEYLLSEVDSVSDVIYSTNIENLKIIPSGAPHHLTNELLASNRMAELARELAARYPDRIVIFDCPPILGITETPVLSNLMGQAVIVVEESKTKIDDVKKAASLLNEDMAIGLVMNKTLKSTKDLYGYYGYGYGSKA
ncbi:XrtA-associated tyrosine autokinase [Colwelliaceae bacterium 6471]